MITKKPTFFQRPLRTIIINSTPTNWDPVVKGTDFWLADSPHIEELKTLTGSIRQSERQRL